MEIDLLVLNSDNGTRSSDIVYSYKIKIQLTIPTIPYRLIHLISKFTGRRKVEIRLKNYFFKNHAAGTLPVELIQFGQMLRKSDDSNGLFPN
jgi:hypothetical protein